MTNENNKIGFAIPKCYFCGKDKNEIIMNTRLAHVFAKRVEEMHGKVIDKEPCSECKKLMEQGVMLIKVKEEDPEYRLGNIAVVKDEAIRKMFTEEYAEDLIKKRACFLSDKAWEIFGLP